MNTTLRRAVVLALTLGALTAAPADNPGQSQACQHAAEQAKARGLADRCTPAPPTAPATYTVTNNYPIVDENGHTIGLWMGGGVHDEDRPILDSVRLAVDTDPAETGQVTGVASLRATG